MYRKRKLRLGILDKFEEWAPFDWISLFVIMGVITFFITIFIKSDIKPETKEIKISSILSNDYHENPSLQIETTDGDTYTGSIYLPFHPGCTYVVKTIGYQITAILEEKGCN